MPRSVRESDGFSAPKQFLVLQAQVGVVSQGILHPRFGAPALVFVARIALQGEEFQVEACAGGEREPGGEKSAQLQVIRVPYQLGLVRNPPVQEEEGIGYELA